jgi:chromosome segregation ATPase
MEFDLSLVVAVLALFVPGIIIYLSNRKKVGADVRLVDAQILANLRVQINDLSTGLDEERRKRRILDDKLDALDLEYRELVVELEKWKRGTERLIAQLRRAEMSPDWIPPSMEKD